MNVKVGQFVYGPKHVVSIRIVPRFEPGAAGQGAQKVVSAAAVGQTEFVRIRHE